MNKILNKKNSDSAVSQIIDWRSIQTEMKNKFGSDIYESWLKKIVFLEQLNTYILLSVPTRFIRDWITSRYLDQILQIVKSYKKEISRIELKIDDTSNNYEVNNKLESLDNNEENISFLKDSFL